MSWGDGKYMDYCFKLAGKIREKKLNEKEKHSLLVKKFKYVKDHANVDIECFITDMKEVLK